MKEARGNGDWQTYRSEAAQMQRFLNGSPVTWLNMARAELHLGNSDKAVAAVESYVAMKQSTEKLLNSEEYKPLRDLRGFSALQKKVAENKTPVLHATEAFKISESDFVAEDIDYDPQSKRFFASSIRKKKIISVDVNGTAKDFVVDPDGWPMMALKIDSARRLLWATEVAPNGFSIVPKSDGASR